ncbi:hypothetical protein BH23GEM8_BH23GEM8_20350 [soil metagenome]
MAETKAWVVSGALGILVLGILVFTAVRFSAGAEVLLPLAILLCGSALVCLSVLRWGLRSGTGHELLGGGAAGIIAMAWGVLEFSPAPTAMFPVFRMILSLLFLMVIASWLRASRQENVRS